MWATSAEPGVAKLMDLKSDPIMTTPTSLLQAKTKAHYDAHPIEFLSLDDERNIAAWQPRPFREFVEGFLKTGQRVADIGCGPGRATLYMTQQGLDVVAVDLSKESIALAKARATEANFTCASNLALPFRSGCFDAVVSDGVVHHTPDAAQAFRENARLVRDGGHMYVAVYRRHRYYYYLYTYLGIPLRWMEKRRLGKFVIHTTALPLYYVVHLLKSRGKRSWQGAKNFFYDYFITPRATFHTYEEVCEWSRNAAMQLVAYEQNVGNVHAFVFRRPLLHQVTPQVLSGVPPVPDTQ